MPPPPGPAIAGPQPRPTGSAAALALALALCGARGAVGLGGPRSCSGVARIGTCLGPRSAREFISTVADPSVYDNTLRPPCGNGTYESPTVVEVQLYLTALNKVDQKLGHLELNGYLRTWWWDPRLMYNSTREGGCFDVLSMTDQEAGSSVWQPDLYVDNLVERPQQDDFASLVQVSPDGTVWRSQQVLLTVSSEMQLGQLPFDKHIATVTVASYSKDTSQIRIAPRGGTTGPGASGDALLAPMLNSSMWAFPERDESDGVIRTPGLVEVRRISADTRWDYLHIRMRYDRRPKFFMDQVIIPICLFLLVSYIQFYVDPQAAPARASLAVIPVLIMRTLSNSVYTLLPEGSQRLWLCDVLTTAMFLCVSAAVEFGTVQYLKMQEQARANKHHGLLAAKPVALALIQQSRAEGITLVTLMRRYAPELHRLSTRDLEAAEKACAEEAAEMRETQTEERSVEHGLARNAREMIIGTASNEVTKHSPELHRRTSHIAFQHRVRESDMLFMQHARKIYEAIDTECTNAIGPCQVHQAITHFNFYMSEMQTAAAMCMFLRDIGEHSPQIEMDVTMSFGRFTNFLLTIDQYLLISRPCRSRLQRVRVYLQVYPPSKRCDIVARVAFPLAALVCVVAFNATWGWY